MFIDFEMGFQNTEGISAQLILMPELMQLLQLTCRSNLVMCPMNLKSKQRALAMGSDEIQATETHAGRCQWPNPRENSY